MTQRTRGDSDRWRGDDEREREHLLRAIARRAWIVAIFVVLTAAAAYVFASLEQEKYSASSALLFGEPDAASQLFPSSPASTRDQITESATNVRLVLSRAVADRVAQRIAPLTPDQVRERITAAQEGQSDVVKVTATDPDSKRAAVLASTYAEEFAAFRSDANAADIRAARRKLARQIATLARAGYTARVRQLRRRDSQLATLQAIVTGDVQVLERATMPTAPSAPRKGRSLVLGGFAGLILGLVVALALEQLDRRLRRPYDIEHALGLPVLATIPRSSALRNAHVGGLLDPQFAATGNMEAFRALRAKLRYLDINREIRSVMVTSAEPGEGKSTVSLGLAAAAASAGDRVLLVEADWRRPALGPQLSDKGLSAVLDDAASLDDVVVKLPVAGSSSAMHPRSRSPHLDVVAAGSVPPNPDELIEAPQMQQLIVDAEEHYDLVVIDTPPIAVVADAFALMASVSGLLIVTRLHRSTRDATTSLRNQLSDLSALILGVVVNGADRPRHYHRKYLRVGTNGAVERTTSA